MSFKLKRKFTSRILAIKECTFYFKEKIFVTSIIRISSDERRITSENRRNYNFINSRVKISNDSALSKAKQDLLCHMRSIYTDDKYILTIMTTKKKGRYI